MLPPSLQIQGEEPGPCKKREFCLFTMASVFSLKSNHSLVLALEFVMTEESMTYIVTYKVTVSASQPLILSLSTPAA